MEYTAVTPHAYVPSQPAVKSSQAHNDTKMFSAENAAKIYNFYETHNGKKEKMRTFAIIFRKQCLNNELITL